jgi:hypothetical protein
MEPEIGSLRTVLLGRPAEGPVSYMFLCRLVTIGRILKIEKAASLTGQYEKRSAKVERSH